VNKLGLRLYSEIIACNNLPSALSIFDGIGGIMYYVIMETKYNVVDEKGRPIEENVSLKRARETVRLNPGSKLVEVKKWQI
jgi:hypothetical protein